MPSMQSAEASLESAATAAVPRNDRAVAAWLLACCALTFALAVVGGITRLTHSGLSIVEWQPIVGTLPPLDVKQWIEIFSQYRQTPEFRQVNPGMTLEEFKGIFWWEYVHRLLGRLVGIAFLLPLLWFALRRRLERRLLPRLAGIFLLGGLQGALGWYMVQSGLVDDPRVSQFRLTAHLGLGVVIYAAMLWTALDVLAPSRSLVHGFVHGYVHGYARDDADGPDRDLRKLARISVGLTALVILMILSGGFVAGIRAGLAYNTFPLMDGHLIPPGIFVLEPWYRNFFSNMATVQFDHRLLAWLLAFLVGWFWLRSRRFALQPRSRLACNLLPGLLALQISLGVAALLLAVPVPLAAAHQAGAFGVLTSAILVNHALRQHRLSMRN